MKPTFALNLTEDGIGLLHRTSKGWQPVGEASFQTPDLAEALSYMRKTALGLAPRGISTKLVLPNSQILYTEVEAPGPDVESRKLQIRAALQGRTPYDVADLMFDWSGTGRTVNVAVVAKETLAEAEGFAVEHRFNPVSFVAIPEGGSFAGEPFFGPTSFAGGFLAEGEKVDRDKDAIVVLQRELPRADEIAAPIAAMPEPKPEPEPEPQPEPDPIPEPEPEPQPDPLPNPIQAPEPVFQPSAAPTPAAEPDPEPLPPASVTRSWEQESLPLDPVPEPAVAEDSRAEDTLATEDWLPPLAQGAALAEPAQAAPKAEDSAPIPFTVNEDLDEAPFAHVLDQTPFPEVDDGPEPLPGAQTLLARGEADDIPPAPASAIRVAFASRRAAGDAPAIAATAAGAAPALGAATPPAGGAKPFEPILSRNARGKPIEDLPPMPRPAQAAPKPSVASKARSGVAKGLGALVKSAEPKKKKPALVADAKPDPRPIPTPMATRKPLVKPGGTFGDAPVRRGKPRFLGLILTGILLVFLALVAAWSSLYLAGWNDTPADPAVDLAAGAADAPGVDDEMLADAQDPEAFPATADAEQTATVADPGRAAELATQSVEEAAIAQASPADAAAAADDTLAGAVEDAPLALAATEPAPQTPLASQGPTASVNPDDQDEIFLAAMDAPPPALDALALPSPESRGDPPPSALPPPPPFGTVYQFDDSGLIRPTPEGILTPEGVLLIAGPPPVKPPSRSETVIAAAAAAAPLADGPTVEALPFGSDPADAAAAAETEAPPVADPALAGFRPKARPEGLAPATDDDATAPLPEDGTAVTSLRPRARPPTVLAAGEQARQESASASLAAQAADQSAAEAQAAADPNNKSLIAISRRPAERPKDMSRAVDAALAAAIRAPEPKPEPEPEPEVVAASAPKPKAAAPKPVEPEEEEEPEVASTAKHVPLKGTVAKQATYVNALNLSKLNLIGVYGSDSKRYALVRQTSGRYKKVRVGDSLDGGRVAAITNSEVRYQKGGRMLALKMPKS